MEPLIKSHPAFALLRDHDFFCRVRVDAGGYGISWNDDIDLSSNEVYEHGESVDVAALGKSSLLEEIVRSRQDAKFSQSAIEEASGVRQPVIARMETAASNPQLDTILRTLAPLGKTLAVVDLDGRIAL